MTAPCFAEPLAAARATLRVAQAAGRSLAPCGRRTRMRRHRPRAAPDAWLDCSSFRGLVWLDAADQTCEVGAGSAPAELDGLLAPHGLMLAVDAPGAAQGTLGGLFMAPDLSLLHASYGAPRDQVLGGSWLLADGTVVRSGARVVKSVAGYDLTRMFLGSRGLLAACLTLTLRLQPRPRALRAARVADPRALRRARLPDPLWHFQEADGAAWAAWDGFLPSHPALAECSGKDFHEARERVLAQFAALPRRLAHLRAPARAPYGPMDWGALQEGCGAEAAPEPEAIALPGPAPPARLAALAQACAPGAPPFAADAEHSG